MKRSFFVTLVLIVYGLAATAQPRFTDSTFGTNGKIITNTSAPYKWIVDMVLQPDDKAVMLAEADYNSRPRIVLLRYTTSGALDAGFSGDSIADSAFGTNARYTPAAMKLQADGKILVCGRAYGFGGNNGGFVVRYLPNGSLDTSFSNRGLFFLPPITIGNSTTSNLPVDNMAILPNGKIVLLTASTYNNYDVIVTRLNTSGSIDSTFGTNGVVAQDVTTSYSPMYTSIEVQTDGKLLIGGNPNKYLPSGMYDNLGLLRLYAGGSIDSTYGTNGQVLLKVGTAAHDNFMDMALQPDGKLVVSGVGQDMDGYYQYGFAVRLTPSGNVDANFGTGGTAILAPTPTGSFYSIQGKLALQADGKILLPGCSRSPVGNLQMAVARLTSSGQPDTGLDSDGFATLAVNGYDNYALAVRQQTDGRLVLTGLARSSSSSPPSVTIGRLSAGGQPDATLNPIAAITPIGSGGSINDEEGFAVHQMPDGKIIHLTIRDNGVSYDLSLYRRTATGTLDNSYGTNGNTNLEIPTGYYTTNIFSGLLSNGQLMLAISWGDYFVQTGTLLMRINTNGKPDSTFGTNGRLYIQTRNTGNAPTLPQVAFRPDGKIMLLYTRKLGASSPDSTLLVRLNADGSQDAGFNGNGSKLLSAQDTSVFTKLYLQPDGNTLIAEESKIIDPNNYTYPTYIRRINADGSIDAAFNGGNPVVLRLEVTGITLQADGKILLSQSGTSITRLLTNGTPDSSFGTNSVAAINFADGIFIKTVSIREVNSNRLLIAGNAYNSSTGNQYSAIIGWKPKGTVDSSFGNVGRILLQEVYEMGDSPEAMVVQADGKPLLTGSTSSGSYSSAILTRLKSAAVGRRYTFTGSGLWSNPANWADGTVPPTTILAGSSVVIDPPSTGECVIDITVHVQTGATVTVKAGKRVRLPGNLIIQ